MGVPLTDKFENTIGIMVVLRKTPIGKPGILKYLITSISPCLEEKITTFLSPDK